MDAEDAYLVGNVFVLKYVDPPVFEIVFRYLGHACRIGSTPLRLPRNAELEAVDCARQLSLYRLPTHLAVPDQVQLIDANLFGGVLDSRRRPDLLSV